MQRRDLDNRQLIRLAVAAAAAIVGYFVILPYLPLDWRTPGSPPLYLLGVLGAVLLLGSAGFLVAKRGRREISPTYWFSAHVWAACLGTAAVLVHSVGHFGRPPALMILALMGLAALGIWARLDGARKMAATLGRQTRGFAPPDPALRAALEAVLAAKVAVLARLQPGAEEALFSPTLAHWLRRPLDAVRYTRLAAEEARLIGVRSGLGPSQAFWRPLHMLLALLFVLGVVIHVATVTFFAGYVADGGEVYWWHLTQW